MTIQNHIELAAAFKRVDELIAEGFEGIETKEQEFCDLTAAIEIYEDNIPMMPLPPQTLTDMIRVKIFERRLKQKEAAILLDIPPSRLSEILNGKRAISLDLAKKLHTRLGIDAAFILEKV